MKTFTVIQGENVFEIEADDVEYSNNGVCLIRKGSSVFAGPLAFTTVIRNDAVKSHPNELYVGTVEKTNA